MDRLKEPSTWAGAAAACSGICPLFLATPVTAAIVAGLGAVAMILREQGSRESAQDSQGE